ncbi:MAG: M3 family peptidase, partial [Cyanobacteria bacterium J06636_28]
MTSTATTSAPAAANPFLIGQGLPPFDRFQPDQAEPAVTQLIDELTVALESLEKTMTPTWEGLATPLTQISERLGWTWGVLGHLMGVKNSPELRAAYEAVQPALVQFATRLSQSKAFYDGFKQLATDNSLSPAQRRIVEAAIRDAELSGVGLEGEAKQQF